MSSSEAAPATGSEQARARAREVWALGDYDRVARDVLAPFGPALVHACRVGPGVRVLDIAAGTGNVALAAARAGGSVVASDLTPALLDVGRRRAEAEGLAIDWVEADAEALPFPDAAFDVVVSSVGVMFAPDHVAAASELLRVCRPAGLIGLVNWTPESWSARFLAVLSAHIPPPPGPPGVLWGDEDHVRGLLCDGLETLDTFRHELVVDHFASGAELCAYYMANFGPLIAAVAADPSRREALERDLLAFAEETAEDGPEGNVVFRFEYLLAVGRRAGVD
jgi:ubiquinone/menaquinone biosynthesis C-methylase UbiE